jgi:sporulation protein YunB
MEKIYSRKRFKILKNRNIKKVFFVIIIMLIAFLVMTNFLRAIDPIFVSACKDKANSVVTIEINKITTDVVEEYKSEEIVTIKEDEEGNVKLLQVNSRPLNSMISDITTKIQENLNNNSIVNTSIPFGGITGIKWISSMGPKIPVGISLAGTIQTKIKNEFNEAGINQTEHRLWLEIICNISILTPYRTEETEVSSEMILSENIIIGGVPNVYMNLEN